MLASVTAPQWTTEYSWLTFLGRFSVSILFLNSGTFSTYWSHRIIDPILVTQFNKYSDFACFYNTGGFDTVRNVRRVKPCETLRSAQRGSVWCRRAGVVQGMISWKPNKKDKRRKQTPHFIFVKTVLFLIFLNERFFTVSKVNFKKRNKPTYTWLLLI